MNRAPRICALALAALALLAPSASAQETFDNGLIEVTAEDNGNVTARLIDSGDEIEGSGLSLSLPVDGHFGIGGTPFDAVSQGSPTPNSGGTTLETEYVANNGSIDLLEITELITLPDDERGFFVQYTITNVSGGSLTFPPKQIADIAPRGDFGIGFQEGAPSNFFLGARTSDASARVTAHTDSPITWDHFEEGEYSEILDKAVAGTDFADVHNASEEHDAGVGVQWVDSATIPDTMSETYSTRFDMVHLLDISSSETTHLIGESHEIHVDSLAPDGQPSANPILYAITGPNATPATPAPLDPNGDFTYVGANPGTDDVLVWEDLNANNAPDSNEPRRSMEVDWNAPPPPPQPSAPATDLAAAMNSQSGLVTGASYVTVPPGGPANIVRSNSFTGFPLAGPTFALMTSGDATNADGNGSGSTDAGGGGVRGAFDATVLKVDVNVPSNASCLSFDFRFLSAEFPGTFNDAFVAELDSTDWVVDSNNELSAPRNFAFDPSGKPITVNATGETEANSGNAIGTNYQLGTPILRASTPVTPGSHSVYLSLFDVGDEIVDSASAIDNLRATALPPDQCKPGAVQAVDPPPVQPPITPIVPRGPEQPPARLALAGDARDTVGDTHAVEATVQTGLNPLNGASLRYDIAGTHPGNGTVTTGGDGKAKISWKGTKAGTDTLTVYLDLNGNGTRDPSELQETLAVEWLEAPQALKTANVEPVSGTVLIKLPRGANAKHYKLGPAQANGFIPLTQATQIPLRSTLDTTKGRVELQTASSSRRPGVVQAAQFYSGQFELRQVGPARAPMTELGLNATLRCTNGRSKDVTAAQRRARSRKLWGNGRGRFRTRGRNSSATVRGTIWLQQDTCTKTTTSVRRGTVIVRDFGKRKNVRVKAGKRYVARARKR